MEKVTYPALNGDQLSELLAWATVEGRNWKSSLQQHSWWRGIPARDKNGKEYPTLYGLRNTHGPSWLKDYRPPAQ